MERLLRATHCLFAIVAFACACCTSNPAIAGPPYLTDDPVPTDVGHWEIYNFASGSSGKDGLGGDGGFDINYGAATDIQLTAVLPLEFEGENVFSSRGLKAGVGDVELALKYRFAHQKDGSWKPDIAFFPSIFVPTADRRFGSGRFGLILPFWGEKDLGLWSVFGGGGYRINPGSGRRNFWQGGVAISRAFGDRGSVGAEVFAQTRDSIDGPGYTAANLGASYKLFEHWSLIGSAGPAWSRRGNNGFNFYAAFKADY